MDGKDFKNIILFMANRWCHEEAVKIFGKILGDHFWSKWCGPQDPDMGTMRLFYDMGTENIDRLIAYIKDNYHGT